VTRQRDELLRAGFRLVERVIGMRADGAEHVFVTLRYGGDGSEFGHMGGDGDHPPDAASLRPRDDVSLFRREIGEIEVAVGVDEHGCGLLRDHGKRNSASDHAGHGRRAA